MVELGEKPFRAEQLARHYFAGHGADKRTDLFPDTPEAGEAVFYLTSIGKGAGRPARSAVTAKRTLRKNAAES